MHYSKGFSLFLVAVFAILIGTSAIAEEEKEVPTALNFKMKSLEGKEVDLAKYRGEVVLMVNVASECGLTPQYRQLQELHKKYGKQGLAVLGFPCNQFGNQEPGSAKEIRTFCATQYGVTFPMFAKVKVNGKEASQLYQHLKQLPTKPKGPGEISWNFEKFLLNRKGEVVARYEPRTPPDAPEVIRAIEAELKNP